MIDIIFPTYVVDEENALIQKECFDSFISNTDLSMFNVIIIDNGSIDVARESEKNMAFNGIYVQMPRPVGFAKAVNIGWRLAENDTQIVCNNDITFKGGWLLPLLEHVNENRVVAPSEHPFEGLSDEIWSSLFVMKRETREKIGYFDDKELPYRYHDQDYWIKAKKVGVTFNRVGASVIGHRESTTFRKMEKKHEYIQREEQIMIARHGCIMASQFHI